MRDTFQDFVCKLWHAWNSGGTRGPNSTRTTALFPWSAISSLPVNLFWRAARFKKFRKNIFIRVDACMQWQASASTLHVQSKTTRIDESDHFSISHRVWGPYYLPLPVKCLYSIVALKVPYKRSIYFIKPSSYLHYVEFRSWNCRKISEISTNFLWNFARFPKFFFVTHTHTHTHTTHTHTQFMIEFELESYCGLYRIAYKNDCFLADSYISWTWELPYALSHPMAYWIFELSSSREYLHTRVAGICHKKVAGRKTRGEWEIGLPLLLHLQSLKIGKRWDTPKHLNTKAEVSQRSKGRKKSKM